MVEGVEDFDDAERRGMKDASGAEGVDDVGGVAGVNDAGRDAGRDDPVVTGTGKDVFRHLDFRFFVLVELAWDNANNHTEEAVIMELKD